MKILKNLLASVLVAMMIFTIAIPVLAEGETDGSITITNALPETDYKIYKIFDVTIGSETEPQSYAYTYKKVLEKDDFLTALMSNDSPFDLMESVTGSGIYEVTLKDVLWESVAEADIMIFLKAQTDNLVALSNVGVRDDDAKTVTFSGLEYAYYYVATASGAALGIDTSSPDATIDEKSQRPGPVDGVYKVFVDDNGDVILGDDGLPQKSKTAYCGEVIKYVLQLQTWNYCEGKKITEFIAYDSLGKGFADFTITKVTLGGSPLSNDKYETEAADPLNIYFDKSAMKISIPWVDDDENFLYDDGAVLKIYCEATLTEEASTGPVDNDDYTFEGLRNNNRVKFSWLYNNGETEETEEYSVTTTTYAIGILKDSNTWIYDNNFDRVGLEHLEGAEFELTYEKNGEKVPLKEVRVEDSYHIKTWYVYDIDGSAETTPVIKSNEHGGIYIMGLSGDETYILKETKAPPGYNLLKGEKIISLDDFNNGFRSDIFYCWDGEGNITKYLENSQYGGIGLPGMSATWHVINEVGAELPSTGGMGTTIFYVVGGLLVIGATVFFITRKRMRERG